MIKATVYGQSLRIAQPLIASDTNNYLEMQVKFRSNDWKGRSKWVHFSQGETVLPPFNLDESDCITKDAKLNLTAGIWSVYIHGTGTDMSRATTETKTIEVVATDMQDEIPLPPVGSEDAEQIDAKSQLALTRANQALEEASKTAPFAERAEAAATNAEKFATEAQASAEAAARSEQQAGVHVTEAGSEADRAAQEAQRATQNILNGVDTHNSDPASHPHLLAEVSRVESIAKGRNFAKVFKTLDEMQTFLLDPENVKTLEVGTNLYIKDLNTPDYWWDGTKAQELEVEHPDLTQYVTKTQLSMELPAVVSQEEYDRLQAAGQLVPGRIYYIDLTQGGV